MSGFATIRQRKRLPHWEAPNSIYFVTFRLADSLPANVLQRIKADRRLATMNALERGPLQSLTEKTREKRLFSKRVEEYLDRGAGACLLRSPSLAGIVAMTLAHFDGLRYKLYAWCVMPNHVHVVLRPYESSFPLAGILHSWKSFSAQRINAHLKRRGAVWQREYYDHLLRDEAQLARAVRYVAENPVRAGLKNWKWVEVCDRD
jgi:REP element-mobilizing transposase RayT